MQPDTKQRTRLCLLEKLGFISRRRRLLVLFKIRKLEEEFRILLEMSNEMCMAVIGDNSCLLFYRRPPPTLPNMMDRNRKLY